MDYDSWREAFAYEWVLISLINGQYHIPSKEWLALQERLNVMGISYYHDLPEDR